MDEWMQVYVSSPDGTNVKETKGKTKAKKGGALVIYDEKLTLTIPKSQKWDIKTIRVQVSVWDKNAVKSNVVVGGLSFTVGEVMDGRVGRGWYKVLSSAEGRETHASLGSYEYPAYGMSRADSFTSIASVAQEAVLTSDAVTGGLQLGIDYIPPIGKQNQGTVIIKLGSVVGITAKEVSPSNLPLPPLPSPLPLRNLQQASVALETPPRPPPPTPKAD